MPLHVRITSRDPQRRGSDTLALDKNADWVERTIVGPRWLGQEIFVSGKVFTWDEIDGIHITWTDETSAQLLPVVRAERRASQVLVVGISDEWYVATRGRDVTEQFITGPPGVFPVNISPQESSQDTAIATNRKAVMVIYGHDREANDALFSWLRAIGLQPREWSQLVHASGDASPYIGQVLEQAFKDSQAVIAFFTPDELVLRRGVDPTDNDTWRLQARPNVLIEAGMALITHPSRTVLVVHGPQELPSDLAGRHYIRLSHTSPEALHSLASRLHDAGCETDQTGTDWLNAARFPDRDNVPKYPPTVSDDAARARVGGSLDDPRPGAAH